MANSSRLFLKLASSLNNAETYDALVEQLHGVLSAVTPYRAVWIYVAPIGSDDLELVGNFGSQAPMVRQTLSRLDARHDPWLRACIEEEETQICVDARTDPRTNKAIVEQLGSRTIVSVPMRVGQRRLGALGVGTYGDEGVVPPSPEDLEILELTAGFAALALARLDAEAKRQRAERSLATQQRLNALGRLAAGIAHDFNNLLVSIVGNTELVALDLPDDPRIADVLAASELAARLCAQLLTFGSHSLEIVGAGCPTDAVVEATAAFIRRTLPSNITLAVELNAGDVRTPLTRIQLERVLLNLIINARDALQSDGGGRIHVSTRHEEESVVIDVIDDGPGIASNLRDRVFEPFVSTREDGHGLGLSVVHGAVRQADGAVQLVECAVGTHVRMVLPSLVASTPTHVATEDVPEGGSSRRVLLCDDDPRARRVMERLLAFAGHSVVGVASGEAALARSDLETFEIIVTDLSMAGIDGVTLVQELIDQGIGAPVLFVTGFAPRSVTSQLEGLPVLWDVLAKPFHKNELLSRLTTLVHRAHIEAA